jgi:pre-mRNA-processing factor 40
MQEKYSYDMIPGMDYNMTEDFNPEEDIDYKKMTEEEKFTLFKQELKKMGVTNTWKWEDANRVLQDSKHYNVLPAIKQKKQAFYEYTKEFTDRINQNKRENRRKQIDEYYEMLDQVQELNVLSKYQECVKYFQSDRRYLQLDEKDREDYFQDYMDELERREVKRKQEHSKRKMDSLKNLFRSHQVTTSTKFEEAKELFKNNAIFNSAEKLDQLRAFSEYITEKIDEEDEIEYNKKIREERKNRENFRELMEELVRSGKLTYKSHWKAIVSVIKDDPRYHKLLLQSGSRPVEIFYDFQDREKSRFNDHKVNFKALLRTKSVKLGANISKDDFNKNLSEHEEYAVLPSDIKELLYDYYIRKVEGQQKDRGSRDSHGRRKHKKRHKSKKRKRSRSRHEVEEGEYVSKR